MAPAYTCRITVDEWLVPLPSTLVHDDDLMSMKDRLSVACVVEVVVVGAL